MNEISQLTVRALTWVRLATPEQIWEAMQHGQIDARVGMPGVMRGLGTLIGAQPFGDSLETREWAANATGDFEAWFLTTPVAHDAARWEINQAINAMEACLGGTGLP